MLLRVLRHDCLMMAGVIPFTSPSDSYSHPEDMKFSATQSSDKPASTNPFSITIKSWEEWSLKLPPPPRLPRSTALSVPPKVDLFCTLCALTLLIPANSPLPFTPHSGPISLDKKRSETQTVGLINLFDSKQGEKSPEEMIIIE